MIRSKIAMAFFWALLALALHVWPGGVDPPRAQGTRKNDIVFNSRSIPLAGATVRVCTMPASGQPCTPRALIYSDSSLSQALANPTTTDGLGNYFFYAAPGQYEIEISGPTITTKQIPNVILPNDPSSPSFSGAVSRFSMNLTGNLNIAGNTLVLGSLASGTLNLSSQVTPPGTPGAGNVNLYTKTATKHLYYKDETGLETSPLGLGVRANVSNTFTASQNFDADIETKGPNPYFSLAGYGGYSSSTSTPPSTTGSISSGRTTLTLASAQDFANGQGIVVYQAGARAASLSVVTPGTPTVTPINLSGGATTYTYKVVAEARNGALTAAGSSGSTTTGAAALGVHTMTLTQCSRTNGIATYTSSATHNIAAGTQIDIEGFSGFSLCNGVKTVASTPTGTTFTANDGITANETNTSGSPTAKVVACNVLSFASGSYSGTNTLRYWIYRNGSLAGAAGGWDPWFMDCGGGGNPPTAPSYVPSTPPNSAKNGYLATTISSGGGTTSLTLANAASNTVSAQTVLHDNTVPLKNAIQAAYNANGGTVYIPNLSAWVFNSTLDMTTGLTVNGAVRIHVNSSQVFVNQPWILRGGTDLEGEPRYPQTYQYVQTSVIAGTAYPEILIPEGGAGGFHIKNLQFTCNGVNQSCVYADSGADGGGPTGIVMEDVSVAGQPWSRPIVWKGGFDFYWNRGSGQNSESSFNGNYIFQLTNSSSAVTGSNSGQIPGRVYVQNVDVAGGSFELTCQPNTFQPAATDYTFGPAIDESIVTPFFHFNCATGVYQNFNFVDVVQADDISGIGTPLIDAANGGISNVQIVGGAAFAAGSPVFIGGKGATLTEFNSTFSNPGNVPFISMGYGGAVTSGGISASGNGTIQYAMPASDAPTVSVSSGGSVPVGSVPYTVQFSDVNGNPGPVSPPAIATTTSGNQTVTVTQSRPPVGAVGWFPYRNGARTLNGSFCTTPIPVTTTTFTDNGGLCGQSTGSPTAGADIFGVNGISTTQLREVTAGAIITHSTPALTANRKYLNPDASGYVPVTGYLNSAYDNATRANGAIGSNWTVTNTNGINIASNNFVGTGTNSVAYWNANPFSTVQFSQVTLTALNGTTDFAGVVVLMSGSGAGARGYGCLEDTTTLFIVKISGTTNTMLTSTSITGAAGDVVRLEVNSDTGALTCYRNGVSGLTTTDTTYTTGSPGIFLYAKMATSKNWSGGNLHPIAQLDAEQDWTKPQHWNGGIPQDSRSFKHQTVTTGSIAAGACSNVTLTWSNPFPDTNYQAWLSVLDSTSAAKGLTVDHVQAQNAASVVAVVCNASAAALTGTLQVLAVDN